VTVALVGAGPGDPGLITVRGLELLRRCDAVVYDRLVAPELVDETPADALRIPRDGLAQEEIDTLLVALGRQGLDVVRLKGGDPYVFGRGGEEALALAEAGVPFEVVPGISSIAAVPAAAGIPLTHRGVADRVTVATAHAADGSPPDYASLATAGGTLVLFMGLGRLRELAAGLIGAGMPAATPAAVVSRGTLSDQAVAMAALDAIADAADGLPGPALVVIGDVVELSARLGLEGGRACLEDAPDAADGLAYSMLVLDEREADEPLAARAEARSR
jgi:uroporphyrin-III C-methyltransferase